MALAGRMTALRDVEVVLPDGRAICIARSLEPRIVIINTRDLR